MTVRIRNNVKVYGPAAVGAGLTAPTSGEDGYVAIADGEDLTYLPGTSDGDVLTWNDGSQTWEAAAPGEGDVTGPASSLDNQVVRFHETTGKIIQAGTNAPTYDDSGNLSINAGTALRCWNAAGTFYVGLAAPTLAASHTLLLPPADGTAGQAIVTDGDGNLSFASVGEGSGVTDHGALTGLTDPNDHTWALLVDGTRTAAYIKFGSYPSTTGYVRLSHGDGVYSRNYANSADRLLLALTGVGDYLSVGDSSVATVGVRASTTASLLTASGTLQLSNTGLLTGMTASAAGLATTGTQSFFRYHDTACIATQSGRSTMDPIDVS